MVKLLSIALLAASMSLASPPEPNVTFTPNNLVILRVGNGTPLTNHAFPVTLDEYTQAGVLVRSIPVSTTTSGAHSRLTIAGDPQTEGGTTPEGYLTLSTDGRYLLFTGYDAAVGEDGGSSAGVRTTTCTAVNRIVARLDVTGAVDTSTRINDGYDRTQIRSACSQDGTSFWTGGGQGSTPYWGGTRYVPLGSSGASTRINTTPAPSTRANHIFAGQLYTSSGDAPPGVSTIGTGLPTTPDQAKTILPGMTAGGNPQDYVFFDRDPATPGLDTLYLADSSGSFRKYYFNKTTSNWTQVGLVTKNLYGLTGYVSGSTVVLFATTVPTAASSQPGGNKLVKLVDAAAFNSPLASSFVDVATAGTGYLFRGVAFAPAVQPCTPSSTVLCIDGAVAGDRRFKVEVDWSTVQGGGQSGKGTAVPAAPIGFAKGGIFWFFNATNPEMLVKVLNGCGQNQSFWVFSSAGTNVGLNFKVTDTVTGALKSYQNPDVTPALPVQDVTAFPCTPGALVADAETEPEEAATPVPVTSDTERAAAPAGSSLAAAACVPSATTLCIDGAVPGDRRFKVEVDWATVQGGGQGGHGTAVPAAPIGFAKGGLFWFFEPTNPEMLVKVLNGCGDNSKFWVFASAGTNVELDVKVTDTATGELRSYFNPDLKPAFPVQDVLAFDCN